ncbi:MAG: CheR family methyltransferase [Myxococcaceae bacterium]
MSATMTQSSRARPVFAILAALVEERAGLHYAPPDQEIFLDKVQARATDAGFESLLDYYYYLRYDPAGEGELARLIETLVVNETFFFRELEPLKVLVEHLVKPKARAGRKVRVWSAACATGEEPLTLAMLLADAGLLENVQLIASDISEKALDRARAGRFGRRALRELPDPALSARWLREEDGRLWVDPVVRAAVDFRRINLLDPAAVQSVGPCDAILCRNVLIYFSDATAAQVVQTLAQQLAPGGALFVGVSESLLRFGTLLACEEVQQTFLYRKAE